MLIRTELRNLFVAQLQAAATSAGSKVYPSRDWPIDTDKPSNFPAILVGTPHERKDSLGRQAPEFTTTVDVVVVARVIMPGDTSDAAMDALDTLVEQIELAILANPAIVSVLQQFPYVETSIGVNSSGRQHTAEAAITFGCELFQYYNPPLVTQLTTIDITTGLNGTITTGDTIDVQVAYASV